MSNKAVKFLLLLLAGWLIQDTWQAWHLTGGLHNGSLTAIVLAGGLASVELAVLAWLAWPDAVAGLLRWVLGWRARLGWLRWPLALGWTLIFPVAALYLPPLAIKLAPASARWLAYGIFAVGAALLIAPPRARTLHLADILRGGLLTAAVFAFLSAYTHVSHYPFPLTWSEGNRLWDYSLKFGRSRYLYPPEKPIFSHTDPGRQLLWGVIFLLPGVDIWWARLWNAVLFSVPYLLLGWAVFWRPNTVRQAGFWAGLWGYLFIAQGPIYAPLVLSALLVVLAEATTALWVAVPLMAVVGFYAALTRFTWLFAPALWAVLLVIARHGGQETHAAYLRRAAWLGGGGLVGALISGNAITTFVTTAFAIADKARGHATPHAAKATNLASTQPLLWERLWPTPTFPPGIVLGVLLAVGPVAALWWLWHRRRLWRLSLPAAFTVTAILGFFLTIGLIASLKIGGGSNLHNLDMFLIGALFFTGALWRRGGGEHIQQRAWHLAEQVVLALLVVVPMYFVFLYARPAPALPPAAQWQAVLGETTRLVREAVAQGGEVLFIDQRQLLTFEFGRQVPLIPEYEKKYMMDQAMAANESYFAAYYRDLANHRFALIVTEPLHINYRIPKAGSFVDENNAWVRWVSVPTLCYYRPIALYPEEGLEILAPREKPLHCEQALPVPPKEQ